jgi:hypothetical protein
MAIDAESAEVLPQALDADNRPIAPADSLPWKQWTNRA